MAVFALFASSLLVGCYGADKTKAPADDSASPAPSAAFDTFIAPTFSASFDKDAAAELARGMAGAGGMGWKIEPDENGGHLLLTNRGGHVQYRASSNINSERGTVSFRTKGNAVAGREGRAWLWAMRGRHYDLGVLVDGGALHLETIRYELRKQPAVAELSLPLKDVGPDTWHTVTASWDMETQQATLSFDGQKVEGAFTMPRDFGPPLAFYLGGGVDVKLYPGGWLKPGNAFDDLRIWSYSRPQMEQAKNTLTGNAAKLYAPVRDGVYRRLHTLEGLQQYGGWQNMYTWPTKLGAYAQGRGFVEYPDIITLDKSNGSAATAARYLYAYDVLGDQSFLETACRTGDMLVEAQNKDGYWLSNYHIGPGFIRPADERHGHAEPKFQDGVQSQALALLLALHKVTGKQAYLDSAKRCGEHYLRAQNPDGSWSYKFDPKRNIGVTFLSEPQGGEINDYAQTDAINIMVLLYHTTKDLRYLQAAKRGGDWLVKAALNGKVHGWAQQYDNQLKPAPARHHEPPALSFDATQIAAEGLVEMYRLSGDDSYLQPVREAAQWIKETFPDGKMYQYYDPATGRPVARWETKIYYLDDPEQFKQANGFPLNPTVVKRRPVPDLDKLLANAAKPKNDNLPLSPEVINTARKWMEAQNEEGLWILDNIGGADHTIGAGFNPARGRMVDMIQFLEAADNAMNLPKPKLSHHGDLLRMAGPADWYNVPWDQVVKTPPASTASR